MVRVEQQVITSSNICDEEAMIGLILLLEDDL